jgi:hypothetical protein
MPLTHCLDPCLVRIKDTSWISVLLGLYAGNLGILLIFDLIIILKIILKKMKIEI